MIFDPNSAWIGDDMDQETYDSLPKEGIIVRGGNNMSNSEFTEEEIVELVDKLEDDFGLFVTTYMNKHKADGIDIKTIGPDGTVSKFEIRRVKQFDEEKEEVFDSMDKGPAFPHLDRDGCVYWDSVLVKGEAEEE